MLNEMLGRRLKDVRELRGLSQTELAHQVGLSRASISNLEAGKQGMSLETLYKIAPVLSTEPRDLLPTLGDMRPTKLSPETSELVSDSVKGSPEKQWVMALLASGTS